MTKASKHFSAQGKQQASLRTSWHMASRSMSMGLPMVMCMTLEKHAVLISKPPARASTRESLSSVGLLSSMFVVLVAGVLVTVNGGQTKGLLAVASQAGQEVLQHIGWAFGVYVPVLLSFYAIVLGVELATPEESTRLRKTLGLVAMVMAASLLPALLLIFIFCIAETKGAGALVVVLPASGVVLFLAVQLGGFLVDEDSEKLARALETKAFVSEQMQGLVKAGERPMWLVVLMNTAMVSGLATALSLLLFLLLGADVTFQPLIWLMALFAMLEAVLFIFCLLVVAFRGIVSSRTAKVCAEVTLVLVLVTFLALAVRVFFAEEGAIIGIVLLVVFLFNGSSAFWPRVHSSQFLLNWSIRGAGSAIAKKHLEESLESANEQILRLAPTANDAASPTLRDRLKAAVSAFRSI